MVAKYRKQVAMLFYSLNYLGDGWVGHGSSLLVTGDPSGSPLSAKLLVMHI